MGVWVGCALHFTYADKYSSSHVFESNEVWISSKGVSLILVKEYLVTPLLCPAGDTSVSGMLNKCSNLISRAIHFLHLECVYRRGYEFNLFGPSYAHSTIPQKRVPGHWLRQTVYEYSSHHNLSAYTGGNRRHHWQFVGALATHPVRGSCLLRC